MNQNWNASNFGTPNEDIAYARVVSLYPSNFTLYPPPLLPFVDTICNDFLSDNSTIRFLLTQSPATPIPSLLIINVDVFDFRIVLFCDPNRILAVDFILIQRNSDYHFYM